jgi:hypothetical protein
MLWGKGEGKPGRKGTGIEGMTNGKGRTVAWNVMGSEYFNLL